MPERRSKCERPRRFRWRPQKWVRLRVLNKRGVSTVCAVATGWVPPREGPLTGWSTLLGTQMILESCEASSPRERPLAGAAIVAGGYSAPAPLIARARERHGQCAGAAAAHSQQRTINGAPQVAPKSRAKSSLGGPHGVRFEARRAGTIWSGQRILRRPGRGMRPTAFRPRAGRARQCGDGGNLNIISGPKREQIPEARKMIPTLKSLLAGGKHSFSRLPLPLTSLTGLIWLPRPVRGP